jgi:cytochrome c oxidase subunit 2
MSKIIFDSLIFDTANIGSYFVTLDSPKPWQMGFQDPATPIMEGIINFHHDLMYFLIIISTFVLWMLLRTIYLFNITRYNSSINPEASLLNEYHRNFKNFTHCTVLEVVWTIIPTLILVLIATPSFALLYAMDEVHNPALTVKIVGHQWYWSYEYTYFSEQDIHSYEFDSFMIPEEDLLVGQFRLLEVDNRLVLPVELHIRLLVTAADVLHRWAVPSLGIKIDACPGRLNQVNLFIKREGVFYGQCSELCGINHSFMPIVVQGVTPIAMTTWLVNSLNLK